MPEDVELLRRYAKDGSQEAFAELVRRRVDLVYSVALRGVGGDRHSAEDVVQMVFRDLARKASGLCRHPVLTGWLFTCTRYAADHVRREAQRRLVRESAAFGEQPEATMPADGEANWNRIGPMVDQLLGRLGQADRMVLLLRFYEGRPYAEIAKVLAGTEDGARMRVQRALNKLRLHLEKRGIFSPAVALAAMLTDQAVASAPVGLAAQAAAASTATLGVATPALLLPLMSMLKTTATAAVLAALGGTAIWEWREQSRLTSELKEVQIEHEKLAALERRPRDSQPISPGSYQASRPRQVANTPASDEYMKRYGLFFRQRGMTQEQIARFVDLLKQRDEIRADLQDAIRKEGESDGPAIEAMRSELDRPVSQGLHALLGDDGYAAYSAFEKMSYYQMGWVQPLNGYFSAANVPLNDAQTQGLTLLLAANDHPTKIVATDLGGESTIDWDAVVAQAGEILNPTQEAVLEGQAQLLKNRQEQNLTRLRLAKGSPGPP
jgi:RNA polymerase sigma factor (sigma-70 family)